MTERTELHLPFNLLFRDGLQDFYRTGFIAKGVRPLENLNVTNHASTKNAERGNGIVEPLSTFHHRPCG